MHETGRRVSGKEECERPGRPSLVFPDHLVPGADCIMQRSPSRLLYIDISMCRGWCRVKRLVAVNYRFLSLASHLMLHESSKIES